MLKQVRGFVSKKARHSAVLETYRQQTIEMPTCPKMFRYVISCYFTIKCPLILEGSSSVCVLKDIFNALERIGLGLEKKDAVMSEQKRKLVAYHEAGALDHWLVHSRKISFSMVHHWYIEIASHMQRPKHADHIQILMIMMILYTAVVGKTMKNMHIKSRPLLIFAGQVMQSWVR